jgi:hypothetical protein
MTPSQARRMMASLRLSAEAVGDKWYLFDASID